MANDRPTIQAAGAVLWRPSKKHGIKIAMIHRPRYDDWSLPKGKTESGETAAMTAAREVWEETGHRPALGRRLRSVSYRSSGTPKVVHYFAARDLGGEFAPGKEVDKLSWVSVRTAIRALHYGYDRAVVQSFVQFPADLSGIVLLRHARAGSRDGFEGDDDERPLDERGRLRAARLVEELLPFAPGAVHSTPLARCLETVQPLALSLGLPITDEPLLSEPEYQTDPASVRRRVTELALLDSDPGSVVVCSQGGVIPGVVKSLAGRGNVALPTAGTSKGSYWYLSFDGKQLVQADRYPAPVAAD